MAIDLPSLVVAAVSFLVLVGCPSCPYDSQCEGSVLHTCSLGPDQLVGDAGESRRECRAPNPVCVDLDDRRALCVTGADETCNDTFVPRCGEGVTLVCVGAYVVADDCVSHGNVCVERENGPRCVGVPFEACDGSTWENRCEGTAVVRCAHGMATREDCAIRGVGGTCSASEHDGRRSVFCSSTATRSDLPRGPVGS